MRTHIAKGLSMPKNMFTLLDRAAKEEGLKFSAFMQQVSIEKLKSMRPGITTDEIMGTEDEVKKPKVKAKPTPAQRVALAKIELAKAKKAKGKNTLRKE